MGKDFGKVSFKILAQRVISRFEHDLAPSTGHHCEGLARCGLRRVSAGAPLRKLDIGQAAAAPLRLQSTVRHR